MTEVPNIESTVGAPRLGGQTLNKVIRTVILDISRSDLSISILFLHLWKGQDQSIIEVVWSIKRGHKERWSIYSEDKRERKYNTIPLLLLDNNTVQAWKRRKQNFHPLSMKPCRWHIAPWVKLIVCKLILKIHPPVINCVRIRPRRQYPCRDHSINAPSQIVPGRIEALGIHSSIFVDIASRFDWLVPTVRVLTAGLSVCHEELIMIRRRTWEKNFRVNRRP